MKINLFSADIKLVQADDPAKRGFKVLEFNDGLSSGFKGFDALGQGHMISGRVVPDYQSLFPGHSIVDLNEAGVVESKRPKILIPRSDALNGGFGRMFIVAAHRMSDVYTTLNSDIHLATLSINKAYQYFAQTQMPEGGDGIFPHTRILPTEFKAAKDDLAQSVNSENGYVLKPVGEAGGTGVRIIEQGDLMRDLARYFKFHGRAEKNWPGKWESACVVQDRVLPNEVKTDEGVFDGTMRVAFTIYGDEEKGYQCKVHDAYWKLPLKPMGEGTAMENVISFSLSNGERKKDKAKALLDVFGLSAEGERSTMHSCAVDDETKAWLFPHFAQKMVPYFSSIHNANHLDNTAALLNKNSPGHQALGIMLLTDGAFYPADGAPDLHYPKRLVEAAKDSLAAKEGNQFITRIFRARVKAAENRMFCENTRGEFIEPLQGSLQTQSIMGMALMMTLQKI